MYQLTLVASESEAALVQLAGPTCIARLLGIAEAAGDGDAAAPEVEAFAAWIFARMADSPHAALASSAPEALGWLARVLPAKSERVRAAASRAVAALAESSEEGKELVVVRAQEDKKFFKELGRHDRLRPLQADASAVAASGAATTSFGRTVPRAAAAPRSPATVASISVSSGSPAAASRQQQQGTVLRLDGELALVVTGPRASTVGDVLRRSVLRRVTELEPLRRLEMSAADRATAASRLDVAFASYMVADNMAQTAMKQINDQCEALAEALLDTDSGASSDPELTEESQRLQKSMERVAQCRVTQLPKHRLQGCTTVQYLERLAQAVKGAADEADAFVSTQAIPPQLDFQGQL